METNLRPVNVIRADLVRAKDLLAAVGFDTGSSVYIASFQRVMRLAEELWVAEDTAERLAEEVALKWIYRYTGGRLMEIDEGHALKRS